MDKNIDMNIGHGRELRTLDMDMIIGHGHGRGYGSDHGHVHGRLHKRIVDVDVDVTVAEDVDVDEDVYVHRPVLRIRIHKDSYNFPGSGIRSRVSRIRIHTLL
jgi:hypothetical protein